MGYIDGHPAVVGGAEKSSNGQTFTNTVEIYKEGTWESYPPTNYSRASASMSWDSKSTYIIGGATTDGVFTTVVNLIEKWDSTRWIILNVVMPTSLLSCGSFPKGESEVFIFGGQQAEGTASTKKFVLNLKSGSIESEDDLESESKFTYGQEIRKIGNIFKVCNSQGKVLELEYENGSEE
jgi:N-acetylneuraminic acid mutarotase